MQTDRAEFTLEDLDMEGLDASWWSRTGKLNLTFDVLEEKIGADLAAQMDLTPPEVPSGMRAWFRDVVARLSGMREITHIPLNPELVSIGKNRASCDLEVLLCSRRTMDDVFDAQGALGLHIIDAPDSDLFLEDAPHARIYRIAMVCDIEELLDHLVTETVQDGDPERYLAGYVESWLITLFHEIEHVRLFAQNAALNSPYEIEALCDDAAFSHDLFDCSSGYGIRPVMPDGVQPLWADDMQQAAMYMEMHVEARGRVLLNKTLIGELDPSGFLAASGLEDRYRARYLALCVDQPSEPMHKAPG